MSMQSEVFLFVSTKKPGDVVRVRYFRPNAESGDGYAERELKLGRWRGGQSPRRWYPVTEFIERMALLRKAEREDWDGWHRLLADFDRDFSWLAAHGLHEARRAVECMHDMGVYVKGHESLVRLLLEHGGQWPEFAMVVAVMRADKGDVEGAQALAESHILSKLGDMSEDRRNFLRQVCARLEEPKRIRLMRPNPAVREVRRLTLYLAGAAPPPRPGESAAVPPNCGWLAGFLDLDDINTLLWRMHREERYVPGFEDLRRRLEREAGSPHMQDTVAWAYADHGDLPRAIEIYKSRVLPFTDDRRYQATLRGFEAMLK